MVCNLVEQTELSWVGTMVALTEKMMAAHLACQMAAQLGYCWAALMVWMMAVQMVCLMVDSMVSWTVEWKVCQTADYLALHLAAPWVALMGSTLVVGRLTTPGPVH